MYRQGYVKQPCQKDCSRRNPGCAVNCPDWAEYVKRRDAFYHQKAEENRVSDAIHDGCQRRAKLALKR